MSKTLQLQFLVELIVHHLLQLSRAKNDQQDTGRTRIGGLYHRNQMGKCMEMQIAFVEVFCADWGTSAEV